MTVRIPEGVTIADIERAIACRDIQGSGLPGCGGPSYERVVVVSHEGGRSGAVEMWWEEPQRINTNGWISYGAPKQHRITLIEITDGTYPHRLQTYEVRALLAATREEMMSAV